MSASHLPSSCVEDTLKEILVFQQEEEKQRKKEPAKCKTGCNSAVEELLHPGKRNKNTIPFILYTKEGCPFKADGITTFRCKCCNKKKFRCFSTFIFRIKELKKGCALLELLSFKREEDCECIKEVCTPCAQIDCENVEDLFRTGICIKVDPSCFCSISCFPPLNLSGSEC